MRKSLVYHERSRRFGTVDQQSQTEQEKEWWGLEMVKDTLLWPASMRGISKRKKKNGCVTKGMRIELVVIINNPRPTENHEKNASG